MTAVRLGVRSSSVLLCVLALAAWAPARADSAAQQARAHRFADKGMSTTLAACDLPRTCQHRAPLKSTAHKRQTGNDLDVDERELVFKGLDIEFLYVLGSFELPKISPAQAYRDPVILELTVTTSDWPVDHGLRIGTPRADVDKVLGDGGWPAPHVATTEPACVSYVNDKTQNEARLCYVRDRLASIKWVQWWDG